MYYYDYMCLMNGLSEYFVLNRIRHLHEFDLNQIHDLKERRKIAKIKKSVSLKKETKTNV